MLQRQPTPLPLLHVQEGETCTLLLWGCREELEVKEATCVFPHLMPNLHQASCTLHTTSDAILTNTAGTQMGDLQS